MKSIIGYVIRNYKDRMYITEIMSNEELLDILIPEIPYKNESRHYEIDIFMQE